MISNAIGALIGGAIDRRDGEGGLGGALLGVLSVGALKRVIPLAVVVGGAYAAKRAWDHRQKGRAEGLGPA